MKKPSDYTYDYDRTEYMARYYEKRRKTLLHKAKKRYRDNRDTLAPIARMKYQPKFKRQNF